MNKRLTAVIQSEGDGFVAFCPELDIASQGSTIQEARDQLREALELFFECASQAYARLAICCPSVGRRRRRRYSARLGLPGDFDALPALDGTALLPGMLVSSLAASA